jgi:hypothetical protein
MHSSLLAVEEDHMMQYQGHVVVVALQQWKRVIRLCSTITATKNVIKYYIFLSIYTVVLWLLI